MVTAIWSIATGAYFAFGDDIIPRLINRETKIQIPYKDHIGELRAQVDRMSGQFLDNKQAEQQLTALLTAQVDRIGQLEQNISAVTNLFTTNTIKPERIVPLDTANFVAPSDQRAHSQPHEMPSRATTKQHRIHRTAHQRASRRHRVAMAEQIARRTSPVEMHPQSSQLTSVTTKGFASIADQ